MYKTVKHKYIISVIAVDWKYRILKLNVKTKKANKDAKEFSVYIFTSKNITTEEKTNAMKFIMLPHNPEYHKKSIEANGIIIILGIRSHTEPSWFMNPGFDESKKRLAASVLKIESR